MLIDTYTYSLPDERIARFPVEPRHSSKLLAYRSGKVSHHTFSEITDLLPKNSFLVFNDTKVIPARLFFQKETGAVIEIFLLNPVEPSTVLSEVMKSTETCTWHCMIGNKKKWKGETLNYELRIMNYEYCISAELIDLEKSIVKLSWAESKKAILNPNSSILIPFLDILQAFGQIPLPPYLKRHTEEKDKETYQTVYSKQDGAVAAPTAGLHFTEQIFENIRKKGIKTDFLTLHVGAGTFQPIKVENVLEHKMHREQIVFSKAFIKNLSQNLDFVVPVGTTSMRSLESLYWIGAIINEQLSITDDANALHFFVEKNPDKQSQRLQANNRQPTALESLTNILNYLERNNLEQLVAETEIFIFPGYEFKICKAIITNFHQPHSTLLLLIAALVGEDWEKMYNIALENDYRFLSYGDSSLLIP